MTKEELENRFIKLFDLTEGFTAKHFKLIIDDLFNSNVVIPKGQSRHPYADVYHAIAEGITCEWKDLTGSDKWNEYIIQSGIAFRIKPSEPVYEWQWYYVKNGLATIPSNFYSEDEVDTISFTRIEETKRERR